MTRTGFLARILAPLALVPIAKALPVGRVVPNQPMIRGKQYVIVDDPQLSAYERAVLADYPEGPKARAARESWDRWHDANRETLWRWWEEALTR